MQLLPDNGESHGSSYGLAIRLAAWSVVGEYLEIDDPNAPWVQMTMLWSVCADCRPVEPSSHHSLPLCLGTLPWQLSRPSSRSPPFTCSLHVACVCMRMRMCVPHAPLLSTCPM